jgi:hypothetical protein
MAFNMSTVNVSFGFANVQSTKLDVNCFVTSNIPDTDPPGFKKIKVRWRKKGTSRWSNNGANTVHPASMGVAFTITGLSANTEYEFKVRYKLVGMSLYRNLNSKYQRTLP